MADRSAVVWTRYGGEPGKIGQIIHTGSEVRLTYDRGAPCGVSILHDPRRLAGIAIPFPVDAHLPLPPYLASLLPPRHGPLWTFLLDRVSRRRGVPASDDELWEVLLEAGRNGIGHLDVFEHDGAAERWYAGMRTPTIIGEGANRRGLWDTFRTMTAHSITDADVETVEREVGPTPGVTGMIPKMLVAADRGWLEPASEGAVAAMVKTEPVKYEGLLHLEAVCYDIHRRAGCEVPNGWLKATPSGSPLLITERFDRRDGMPVPSETVYAALRMRTLGKVRQRWSDPNIVAEARQEGEIVPRLEHVARIFAAPGESALFGIVPGQEKEVYRRVALALMTGNSDLHLENLSFLGPRGEARLTPVYDPAPMRCYDQHAMILALDFGDLGLNRCGRKSVLWEKYVELAGTLKIRRDAAIAILLDCRDAADGYIDHVRAHIAKRREVVVQRSMARLATELEAERGFLDQVPGMEIRAPGPERPWCAV